MKEECIKDTAKEKILDAAIKCIRAKGYTATTVDELCNEAKVTKGAFFHYFDSKEELGIAAANYWSEKTSALFSVAPYHRYADPLQRLLGYIDFRIELLKGSLPEFTCLVGTMVQEMYDTSPAIRGACYQCIFGHSAEIAKYIESAKRTHVPAGKWTSASLALHIQTVIQGSFILAKAAQDQKRAVESIMHLRRYIEYLFNADQLAKKNKSTIRPSKRKKK